MHYELSAWLLPAEPLATALRQTVNELAVRYDAAGFEPHVTLYGGPASAAEGLNWVRRLAQSRVIELVATGLSHSDIYTKTFYIQFAPSADAAALTESVRALCEQPSDYQLNPHLSLLYRHGLSAAERQSLCETLSVPTGRLLFDRVRVIGTEIPLTTNQQIRDWRTIAEAPLRQ